MVQNFPTYDGNHSKGCAVIVVKIVELLKELWQLSIKVGGVLLHQVSHYLFGHSIKNIPSYESNVTSLDYIGMDAYSQGDTFFLIFLKCSNEKSCHLTFSSSRVWYFKEYGFARIKIILC